MGQLKKSDILKKGDFQVKHPFSFLVCCLALSLSALSIHAQTAQPTQAAPAGGTAITTETDPLAGADITMRFYNRTVYYPGNAPSEPIVVQVTITNNGPETLRFKLADDRFFSVDFNAVNTRNLALDHTETWMRRRNTNRQIFFRELSIEPGESYSFTENVKDYLKIENPGMYVLDCTFYPELRRKSDNSEPNAKSNRLTLEIKPSPGAAATKILPVSPTAAEILQPQPIPPDQVVTYILIARQKSQWNQFFLYLDVEQMLSRDPARSRRFRAESESGRYAMIENYKSELSQSKVDKDISTIPKEFRIEKTSYTDAEGTVTVLEWFDYKTFREKKRFTYYLASRDGIWYVNDYTVDNLGTE